MSQRQQTPAQIIFNRKFICQLQHMHTLRDSDINIFGISSSGDRNIDDGLLKAWVHVQMTIAEMVTLSGKGVPIILDNPADSVVIYETLKQHLTNWQMHVSGSVNTGKVPMDDLRMMDEFAAKIYPMACTYKPADQLKISKGIQDMLNRGPKSFRIGKAGSAETLQIKKEKPQPHISVANIIAREFGNKNNTR